MKSNIFLPEKINVGFQERSDTYTKKLAYVIYYDQKGVLRKETSWNSWRDKEIEPQLFENVPTEGFVLNKKAGGYSTGWNHRQTYVRVYDPRGFEFEIDITNLLYILENTNSIKGKGLEGEFIYGWDGKELVLIPTSSPDYKEISEYNSKIHSDFKLKGKTIKIGTTYLTKDNEEWVYLGRFDQWQIDYDAFPERKYKYSYDDYPWVTKGKAYFFHRKAAYGDGIETIKSLNKFISIVTEEYPENYADLVDKLERNSSYSPVDRLQDKYVPYEVNDMDGKFDNRWSSVSFYDNDKKSHSLRKGEDGVYYYEIDNPKYSNSYWNKNNEPRQFKYEYESLQDFIDKVKPTYREVYLKNGKLYSEGK